ncbi:hypothetical protein NMY22_g14834 [Coprinellus aureogranulatus]|nr:hypothetical protein NMY22_g14834 [Coprinellus aureogranulatus]
MLATQVNLIQYLGSLPSHHPFFHRRTLRYRLRLQEYVRGAAKSPYSLNRAKFSTRLASRTSRYFPHKVFTIGNVLPTPTALHGIRLLHRPPPTETPSSSTTRRAVSTLISNISRSSHRHSSFFQHRPLRYRLRLRKHTRSPLTVDRTRSSTCLASRTSRYFPHNRLRRLYDTLQDHALVSLHREGTTRKPSAVCMAPPRKKGKETSPPPIPPKRSNKKPAKKQAEAEAESPRKYKPILLSHIEVPRLPREDKRKYIGGGDSDTETRSRVIPTARPQRIASQRPAKYVLRQDPSLYLLPTPLSFHREPPVCTVPDEDWVPVQERDGREPASEEEQDESIGARMKRRRAGAARGAQAPIPPTPVEVEDETASKQEEAPAPPTPKPKKKKKKSKSKKTPTPSPEKHLEVNALSSESEGSAKKKKKKKSGKGKNAPAQDGDVFTGLQKTEAEARAYSIPALTVDSDDDLSGGASSPIRARSLSPAKSYYERSGDLFVPATLINTAKVDPQQRPFTPETAPIHHLYDYVEQRDEDLPKKGTRVIWQLGRRVSIVKAPPMVRFTGTGLIRVRPKKLGRSPMDDFVSYMLPDGDGLWYKLPQSYYISEAYKHQDQLALVKSDYLLLEAWLARVRKMFKIGNAPSTTVHTCRLRDINLGLKSEHTFTCQVSSQDTGAEQALTAKREGATTSLRHPPSSLPRPFTQPDPIEPYVGPTPSASARANKRKKEKDEQSSDDPISDHASSPLVRKPLLKKSRLYSPINTDDRMDVDEEEQECGREPQEDDGNIDVLDAGQYVSASTWREDQEQEEEFNHYRKSKRGQSMQLDIFDDKDMELLAQFNAAEGHQEPRMKKGERIQKRRRRDEDEQGDLKAGYRSSQPRRNDDDEEPCKSKDKKVKTRRADNDKEQPCKSGYKQTKSRHADDDRKHPVPQYEDKISQLQYHGESEEDEERPRKSNKGKEDEEDDEDEKDEEDDEKDDDEKDEEDDEKDKDEKDEEDDEKDEDEDEDENEDEDEDEDENEDEEGTRRTRKTTTTTRIEAQRVEDGEDQPRRSASKETRSSEESDGSIEDKQSDDDQQTAPVKDKGKAKEAIQPVASGSRAEEIWTAENIELLSEVSTGFHTLIDRTGLPARSLLKKMDLVITFSRENAWNTFLTYLSTTHSWASPSPLNPFTTRSTTAVSSKGGEEAWELEVQRWKDVILRAHHVDEDGIAQEEENMELAEYMRRILNQQNRLAVNVRHEAPIDIISLVFSNETPLRGMSRFVAADPNFKLFFDSLPGDTRAFIDRVITTADNFRSGVLDPTTLTFERFQDIVLGRSGAQNSKLPAQTVKVKVKKEGTEDVKLSDYRGMVESYRQKGIEGLPESIQNKTKKERQDRIVCRTLLRGFFADAMNKALAPTMLWGTCWLDALVKCKLTFHFPADSLVIPGSPNWSPSKWNVDVCDQLTGYVTGKKSESTGKKPEPRVRMVPWSEDHLALSPSSPLYSTIPIVVSSTRPKGHVIKTVGDTLKQQTSEAGSAGADVIGKTDKPMKVARARAELKHDIKAVHRAGTVKNPEMLARFAESRKQKQKKSGSV